MRRLYKNRILHLITHTFHHSRNTRLKEQVVLPEIDGSCIEARRQTNEEHAVAGEVENVGKPPLHSLFRFAGEPLELAGTKQTFRKFTTGILRFVTFRIIALAFVLLEFSIFTRALFRGILQTQPMLVYLIPFFYHFWVQHVFYLKTRNA
ncbi:hypothetical protein HanRHA438_Chr10g0454781 [Helianthus annuus]|nr:hypothetical protein HanRHA438_Chr10g0454781 [Helianthus annuus]